MWEECDECGKPFVKKFEGHTTCFACWSQTPEGQAWMRRKEEARARANQRDEFREQHQERTVYRDLPGFDKAFVRRLLQLCHPDKHDGSKLAVEVTQWLNDRMKEMR